MFSYKIIPFFLKLLIFTAFLFCFNSLQAGPGVKNAPVGKAFVYFNKIKVISKELNVKKKKELEGRLYNFLDDSLQVRIKEFLFFGKTIKNPPVFDSINIDRSIVFMNNYLKSLGYFRATFDTPRKEFKIIKGIIPQTRVSIYFTVNIGKPLIIDSLDYDSLKVSLKPLTFENKDKSLIKKGDNYSKQIITAELDRLVNLYRSNGYFKINRNSLLAVADTSDPFLISNDNIDPFEQLISAQKRIDSPTVIISIREKPGIDSTSLMQHKYGKIFFYPDVLISENVDSIMRSVKYSFITDTLKNVYVKQRTERYKSKLLFNNNKMISGNLYNDNDYFKTINFFQQLGTWQQLDVRTLPYYNDSIPLVDFHVFLIPSKRWGTQSEIEASQNTNVNVDQNSALNTGFLGLSVNASIKHRNAFKIGIQSYTNLRFGAEINFAKNAASFFQTLGASISQSFALPKLLWRAPKVDAQKTLFNFSGSYTSRNQFYKQTLFGLSLQHEWRRKNYTSVLTLPSLELTNFFDDDSLLRLIAKYPTLTNSFSEGNISSIRYNGELFKNKTIDKSSIFRYTIELPFFTPKQLLNQKFFKFIKIDAQWVKHDNFIKSSLHQRLYGGVGWDLKKGDNTMPFFRQFISGGSNSMRAWRLRQLGIGSSLETDNNNNFTDRYGDIQIEYNIEYRYNIIKTKVVTIEGANFLDAGNIWNHFKDSSKEAKFPTSLNEFYKDIAVGVGQGFRINFNNVIIRFDIAYKLKDPVRGNNGWTKNIFEYKSISRSGKEHNNVALQFGIGYPF